MRKISSDFFLELPFFGEFSVDCLEIVVLFPASACVVVSLSGDSFEWSIKCIMDTLIISRSRLGSSSALQARNRQAAAAQAMSFVVVSGGFLDEIAAQYRCHKTMAVKRVSTPRRKV